MGRSRIRFALGSGGIFRKRGIRSSHIGDSLPRGPNRAVLPERLRRTCQMRLKSTFDGVWPARRDLIPLTKSSRTVVLKKNCTDACYGAQNQASPPRTTTKWHDTSCVVSESCVWWLPAHAVIMRGYTDISSGGSVSRFIRPTWWTFPGTSPHAQSAQYAK